jgi:hypothetical protein
VRPSSHEEPPAGLAGDAAHEALILPIMTRRSLREPLERDDGAPERRANRVEKTADLPAVRRRPAAIPAGSIRARSRSAPAATPVTPPTAIPMV